MKKYERTKDSIRNIIFGLILKIIILFGGFVTRTMLIYLVGIEYVGLDGLFSSILMLLNMAELGFSSAIVYRLYKPIAEDNTEQVCALLNYYRHIYRWIGIVVFVLGIMVIPFLDKFISGSIPADINIYLLYLIYLFNTCFSYWFFAYNTALLNAQNRGDMVSKVNSAVSNAKYLLQFICLLVTKSYYAYVIVIPITTLASNIAVALIAKKYFPHYVCRGQVSVEEKRNITKKVSALLLNKIGVSLINGSDNVVISAFLGLKFLGIYNLYYYVFSMIYGFFTVFHSAITAGIGNSIVTESVDDNYRLFRRLFFINSCAVGFCSICLCCLYRPFMILWAGESRTLSFGFSLLMSLYFYWWMIRFVVIVFKNAQGLWWEDRFRALLEAALNLTLNIIMVRVIGIYGITLSTIISMLIISVSWETHILFSKYFKRNMRPYLWSMLKNFLITLFAGSISYISSSLINGSNVIIFLGTLVICIVVSSIIYLLFYSRTDEFRFALDLIKKYAKTLHYANK